MAFDSKELGLDRCLCFLQPELHHHMGSPRFQAVIVEHIQLLPIECSSGRVLARNLVRAAFKSVGGPLEDPLEMNSIASTSSGDGDWRRQVTTCCMRLKMRRSVIYS